MAVREVRLRFVASRYREGYGRATMPASGRNAVRLSQDRDMATMRLETADALTDKAGNAAFSGHPLEFIPFFRRWPCSTVRDLIYTFIFNGMFVVAFSGLAMLFDPHAPLWSVLRVNFVFAQCIGYSIHLLFVAGDHLAPGMRERSMRARVVYYAGVPIVGVFIGYYIGASLLGAVELKSFLFSFRGILATALMSVVVSAILLLIFVPREHAARLEAQRARERARVADAERETATARMQLLAAQIEPHFLYNTLAHVMSLIDAEPALAKTMLERLIALLRSSASAATGAATLASQVDLLRAYLGILELRMGSRLSWTIDIAPDAAPARVPAMLLQPLVENAIKHGLEPKVAGGQVTVAARRDGDRLTLAVTDTGAGFRATRVTGDATGLGLANVRARLATLYGGDAALAIEDNVPSGARVVVTLPWQT
jgi:signal transduction histidine kinase